jgi:hypothetical protein
MLSEDTIPLLVDNLEEAPVFIDLLGDVVPDPVLLSRYVKYCSQISKAGSQDWKENRARASQSIFFLIAAIHKEGIISNSQANMLLSGALDAFAHDDQAAFAGAVAEFLSGRLIPSLPGTIGFLKKVASQNRVEDLQYWLQLGEPEKAIRILSPSERFLLCRRYIQSLESLPVPTALQEDLSRISEIVPRPDSPEYNAFRQEVDQYGTALRSRAGLSGFSFERVEPYEQLAGRLRPQYLYDRICDLKIRLAELNYDLGMPAALYGIEVEPALRSILPQSEQARTGGWKHAVERINQLNARDVMAWVGEIVARISPEAVDSELNAQATQ